MNEKDSIIQINGEMIKVSKPTADAYYELLKSSWKPPKKNASSKVASAVLWVLLLGIFSPLIIWLFRWSLGLL